MYINTVAKKNIYVKLYLRNDFYNIIFKIKHKLFVASRSAPTRSEILFVRACVP